MQDCYTLKIGILKNTATLKTYELAGNYIRTVFLRRGKAVNRVIKSQLGTIEFANNRKGQEGGAS